MQLSLGQIFSGHVLKIYFKQRKVLSYFPIEILNYGSKWHLLAVLFGLLVTRLLSFYEASLFLNESI